MAVSMTLYLLFAVLCLKTAFGRDRNSSSCPKEFTVNIQWGTEFANAPFVSQPLLVDIDGDGYSDIVGATFIETVKAVSGDTGRSFSGTKWPYYLNDASVLSDPVLFDINHDGKLDINIFTSDGTLLPLQMDGSLIPSKVLKLKSVYVSKKWHEKHLHVHSDDIQKYAALDKIYAVELGDTVSVDPHILATPLFCDLNNDDVMDQLVMPVSYYFDKEYYSKHDADLSSIGLKFTELDNYLLSAILIYNITTLELQKSIFLDLTKVNSDYPAYLLSSPVLADLNGKGTDIELMFGTSTGKLHVLNAYGKYRKKFPLTFHVIHGDISLIDANKDGNLDIILIDTTGLISCVQHDGVLIWETKITGTSSPGSVIVDVNLDGDEEIIVSSNDGTIWVLDGTTGKPLQNWPKSVGNKLTMKPLVTSLRSGKEQYILAVSDAGNLHIINSKTGCEEIFNIDESSYVSLMRLPSLTNEKVNILLGTKDGTLMNIKIESLIDVMNKFEKPRQMDIKISTKTKQNRDITGKWFQINFELIDTIYKTSDGDHGPYNVKVYLGSRFLTKKTFKSIGELQLDVPTVSEPVEGHVVVIVENAYGFQASDSYTISLNVHFRNELPWLLIIPFIVNMLILLLLYGFPSTTYLPVTHSKDR